MQIAIVYLYQKVYERTCLQPRACLLLNLLGKHSYQIFRCFSKIVTASTRLNWKRRFDTPAERRNEFGFDERANLIAKFADKKKALAAPYW